MLKLAMAALAASTLLTGPTLAAGLTGENLVAEVPEPFELGWKTRKDNMDMLEYVPHGERVEDWSKMITVQVFHGPPSDDASSIGSKVEAGWTDACAGGAGAEATSGEENGYGFAVWNYDCPLNADTGKPENMFLKVIVGADALYMVQYAYRAIADEAMIVEAMNYLKGVGICDTRDSDKACPADQ